MDNLFEKIAEARASIAGRLHVQPRVAIVLGSGLGGLADEVADATVIPYAEIPHFPVPTVHGHRGELAIGRLAGQDVAVMRGRFHFYEGYSMQEVTFPLRVLRALGCAAVILTNAAGGLHADWKAGDLMLIRDTIFLPGMAGHHPLRGPNDERLGTRFPAMVGAMDQELSELARRLAREQGTPLREGVYIMLSGPSFESAAELRMFRAWGGDAVGMSTAPELVVAQHAGMRALAISLISNLALPDGSPANHAEVIEAGEEAKPRFGALLKGILAGMG
jgi:purine-nucleoside phosphorylase